MSNKPKPRCRFCRSPRLETINVSKTMTTSFDLQVCRDCGKVGVHD